MSIKGERAAFTAAHYVQLALDLATGEHAATVLLPMTEYTTLTRGSTGETKGTAAPKPASKKSVNADRRALFFFSRPARADSGRPAHPKGRPGPTPP